MTDERDPDDPINNEALLKAKENAQCYLEDKRLARTGVDYLAETVIKLADEVLFLKKQVQGHCDRIAAQSHLLSRVADMTGTRVNLRECWVNKDDLRQSRQSFDAPAWEGALHSLVLESIVVADQFRRKGICKAIVGVLANAVDSGQYDLAIVEGVQSPILAEALARWGWRCDARVSDFYWTKKPKKANAIICSCCGAAYVLPDTLLQPVLLVQPG